MVDIKTMSKQSRNVVGSLHATRLQMVEV